MSEKGPFKVIIIIKRVVRQTMQLYDYDLLLCIIVSLVQLRLFQYILAIVSDCSGDRQKKQDSRCPVGIDSAPMHLISFMMC